MNRATNGKWLGLIAVLLWASACGDEALVSDLNAGDGSVDDSGDDATGDGTHMRDAGGGDATGGGTHMRDAGGGDASVCECDDGNPCTEDVCTIEGQCVSLPGTMACDDGDPCTTNDACSGGECRGEAMTCDSGNACQAGRCEAGSCVYENVDGSCNDDNACTVDDVCVSGSCVGTPSCDDGNVCTDDACVDGDCVHVSNAASCDDGIACTTDSCDPASGCVYETIEPCCGDGVCDVSEGCSSCAEDCACTARNTCSTAACQDDACVIQPRDCSDGDPCTADSCALVGGCFNPPISCEGDGICHPGESGIDCSFMCDDGQCVGLETAANCSTDCVPNCGNGNCDPDEDCTSCPRDCGCPDADACNAFQCVTGACVVVPLLDCDDSVACTVDTCDPQSGCKHSSSAQCCGDRTCESGEDGSTCSDDCADVTCCVPHRGGGCDNGSCQDCVCDIEPTCCAGDWSTTCVFLSRLQCFTSCTDCDVCGNGYCGAREDCNDCPHDCGCDAGLVCTSGQCVL